MKEIEIFSLGEWEAFWAVIHNFLGWAYECTYPTTQTYKSHKIDYEDRHKKLLQKVVEKGGKLHIYHLFEPFVDSDLPQYQRKFVDNGMRLIRYIVKTDGLVVDWDINDDEKDIIFRYSPPLYNRIFKKHDKL